LLRRKKYNGKGLNSFLQGPNATVSQLFGKVSAFMKKDDAMEMALRK
jgi:hypothetical protein